jgi:cytochrome c peroxidase
MPAGAVSGSAGAVTLTPEEWSTVMAMSPLPSLPSDTTNRFADDPAAARLGQRLFFDASTSGPLPVGGGALRLSCASCHAGPAMSEPAPELQPAMMGPYSVKRNALGLVNASHYRWVNWGGRFAAQWELPLAVAENPNILASSRLQIVHLLYSRYRADYEAIFGPLEPALGTDLVRFPSIGKPKATDAPDGPWESMKPADRELVNRAFVNYGKSIAAYLRRLVSGNSRFDAFVAGDRGALTPFELGGLRLFVGRAGCTGCHGGPRFTDDAFHDLGVKPAVPDNGRFDDVPPLLASPFNVDGPYSDDRMTGRLAGLKPTPDLTNLFRTPSLRDVALTAPYLHNGRSPTLDDAIRTHLASASFVHDPLLQPIALSPDEIGALVAFLGSLTSAPLPSELLAAPAR